MKYKSTFLLTFAILSGIIIGIAILFRPDIYVLAGSCFAIITLILIFIRPYFGIIIYYATLFMLPEELAGTPAPLIICLITTLFCLKDVIKTRGYKFVFGKQSYFLSGLWLMMVVSVVFAYEKSHCWKPLLSFSKTFIFYFVTINLIRTKKDFKILLWAIAVIFGILALKCNVHCFLFGPGRVAGAGGDNNHFALALIMALPFSIYLFFSENLLLKKLLLGIISLCIIATVILTFSRGGFIGLIGVLSLIFLKARTKALALYGIVFLVLLFIVSIPSGYIERLNTILEYQKDDSAMGRIYAWRAGGQMIWERPLIGIGLGNFAPLAHTYDSRLDKSMEAHNSFIHLAGECGLISLLLFIMLISTSMIDSYRIRRNIDERFSKITVPACKIIEVSLGGYVLAGSFLSEVNFELVYLLFALSVILKRL
ncbi:MAG: putative O-glycosylation ligase, exosortase A system-associated [bacterium]